MFYILFLAIFLYFVHLLIGHPLRLLIYHCAFDFVSTIVFFSSLWVRFIRWSSLEVRNLDKKQMVHLLSTVVHLAACAGCSGNLNAAAAAAGAWSGEDAYVRSNDHKCDS